VGKPRQCPSGVRNRAETSIRTPHHITLLYIEGVVRLRRTSSGPLRVNAAAIRSDTGKPIELDRSPIALTYVRFSPESGYHRVFLTCPLRAKADIRSVTEHHKFVIRASSF